MGDLFNALPPYLSPTNDIAFRRIFGNREKRFILISFLNHVLNLPEDRRIQEVEILDPQQVPHLDGMKESIVDVKCIDQRGVHYIVEMQVANQYNFRKRTLLYASYTYVAQLGKGDHYPELNDVVFLGVLDFNLTKNPHYVSTHRIFDEETHESVIDDFRFTFIELQKFDLKKEELQTIAEKWIFFLKNAENLKQIPDNLQEPEIVEAFELLQRHGWNADELETYYARGMNQRDEYEREKAVEERIRVAVEDAVEENKQRIQDEERWNIARNLLQVMSEEEVARHTDLPLEKIRDLKTLS